MVVTPPPIKNYIKTCTPCLAKALGKIQNLNSCKGGGGGSVSILKCEAAFVVKKNILFRQRTFDLTRNTKNQTQGAKSSGPG